MKTKIFLKKMLITLVLLMHILALIAFAAAYFPSDKYPVMSLIAFSIPFWLFFELVIGVLFLWIRPWGWFVPWLVLLMGFHFLRSMFSLGLFYSRELPQDKTFSVLSYNVHVFNKYAHLQKEKPNSPQKMMDWITQHPAEIKCFQEFAHLEGDTQFNTLARLGTEQGYQYQVSYPPSIKNKEGYFGNVIMSKLPIIKSGDFPLQTQWHVRGVYADVQVGKDTVRIINVHLQSFVINQNKLFQVNPSLKSNYQKLMALLRKIRHANANRAEQYTFLEKFIKESPHPIILTGDFNELPWGYIYRQLKNHFYNAFEVAGHGWGFTFNGKIPFLRIDNQFYSPQIRALSFKTWSEIPHSDHFPIEGRYAFP